MNIFWQITLIEFLLNVAVFVSAVVVYGPIRILMARLSRGSLFAEQSASGALFGIATATAVLSPAHLEGGAAVGCTTILLALVGPLEGSKAMVGSLVFAVTIELLPWAIKAQTNQAAILSFLVSAAVGFLFHLALTHPNKATSIYPSAVTRHSVGSRRLVCFCAYPGDAGPGYFDYSSHGVQYSFSRHSGHFAITRKASVPDRMRPACE